MRPWSRSARGSKVDGAGVRKPSGVAGDGHAEPLDDDSIEIAFAYPNSDEAVLQAQVNAPMLTILQIFAPADIAAARDLVREFTAWAFTLEPDSRDAPTFHDLESELAALPEGYEPPTGCFLLARAEGLPVGCVAFRAHGDDTVELKRMYVRPDQRGKRIGQELVSALVAKAREQNIHRIILDSHRTMTSAHRIYRAAGFRDVAAPAGFPEQFLSRVVFMEMDLG